MDRTARTHNQTAAERRDAVIDAAITEFAHKGLHGTSTEDIARRVGISQPYIFRLFGTKRDLFIAATARVCDRIRTAFEQAAVGAADGQSALGAMGFAYSTLLTDREELLLLLHAFAACDDPVVQAAVRANYAAIFSYVREATGISQEQTSLFFASGMLVTVAAAMDLPMVVGCTDWEEFARTCAEMQGPPYLAMALAELAGQAAARR